MTLRHVCGAGNCYKDRYLPDWGILDGCFPRGIKPSDVDGIVDIGGHTLYLEWKSEAKSLPGGQKKMFEDMTRAQPKTIVLIIWGPKAAPQQLQTVKGGRISVPRKTDRYELRDFCERWAKWAEADRYFK